MRLLFHDCDTVWPPSQQLVSFLIFSIFPNLKTETANRTIIAKRQNLRGRDDVACPEVFFTKVVYSLRNNSRLDVFFVSVSHETMKVFIKSGIASLVCVILFGIYFSSLERFSCVIFLSYGCTAGLFFYHAHWRAFVKQRLVLSRCLSTAMSSERCGIEVGNESKASINAIRFVPGWCSNFARLNHFSVQGKILESLVTCARHNWHIWSLFGVHIVCFQREQDQICRKKGDAKFEWNLSSFIEVFAKNCSISSLSFFLVQSS